MDRLSNIPDEARSFSAAERDHTQDLEDCLRAWVRAGEGWLDPTTGRERAYSALVIEGLCASTRALLAEGR